LSHGAPLIARVVFEEGEVGGSGKGEMLGVHRQAGSFDEEPGAFAVVCKGKEAGRYAVLLPSFSWLLWDTRSKPWSEGLVAAGHGGERCLVQHSSILYLFPVSALLRTTRESQLTLEQW
jgi:hypothetical protein